MNEIAYTLLQTSEYVDWVKSEPPRSQVQINKRLSMIKFEGYFGDHKSISFYEKGELKDKIWELRWKDGRRIYYAYIPEKKILLLLGGNKMDKLKTSVKRRPSSSKTRRIPQSKATVKSKKIAIREGANLTELDPIASLLDPDLIGSAIMQCLIENDPEGVMEIIEDHLYALNKSKFLKEANVPRSTMYQLLKRKNPTIKTLAKIMYATHH